MNSTCVVSLTLPLPPRGCSPNLDSHRHWRLRSRGRGEYRMAAKLHLMQGARGVKAGKVRISCAFWCGKVLPRDDFYRPKDEANGIASLKAMVDGFVDAGLVPDDDAKHVTWGSCQIHGIKESGRKSCVEVTIEIVEPEGLE